MVTYATQCGSTAEVAAELAGQLRQAGHEVTLCPLHEVEGVMEYEAVVVGGPMIFGWHRAARRFLRQNRTALVGRKLALFACAMRLVQPQGPALPVIPLKLDEQLVAAPKQPGRLSLKERFTSLGHYLRPMLRAVAPVQPLSVAFFGGKLEMYRLAWWQAGFILAVVQAAPGDFRNWACIRAWGSELAQAFAAD